MTHSVSLCNHIVGSPLISEDAGSQVTDIKTMHAERGTVSTDQVIFLRQDLK